MFNEALTNNLYVTIDIVSEYDGRPVCVVIPSGKTEYNAEIDYYGPFTYSKKNGETVVE